MADLLSRIECVTDWKPIDFEIFAESQKIDEELNDFLKNNKSTIQLKLVNIPNSTKVLLTRTTIHHKGYTT